MFLIAGLKDPGPGTTHPARYVFIPDVHLVPRADARRFPWVTAREAQVDLLASLAGVLGQLRRTDGSLRVWQLGDFFDLWRVSDLGGDPLRDVSDTQADRPAHGHQFDPIETLPREVKEPFARGAKELVAPIPRSMLEAANPHWDPAVTCERPAGRRMSTISCTSG